MKVKNMISNSSGREIPNQFIIETDHAVFFQSYNSIICKIAYGIVYLDELYWDYSSTTSKYRNQFLGKTTEQIKRKIANCTYKLVNLN